MTADAGHVAEFVRALALGWKNLAAYPPGHPILVNSLDLIHRRLAALRGPAGEIVLGIARDGVVYGEEKIESSYAQKFGNALYTRGVALLRFDTNTDVEAIGTFLRLLGAATAADSGRPIWEELTAAGVISIHLQPVDYSDIHISDELEADRPKTDAEALWDEILHAMIEGREMTPEGRALFAHKIQSTSELAALILQYSAALAQPAAFDPDATFGVKFAAPAETTDAADDLARRVADSLGGFIARSTGGTREVAVQQAIELLKSLPDAMRATVMRSVMRALAGDESAGTLLRELVSHLPSDQVLDALRYLSTTMPISTHAMRLVESLMATAADHAVASAPPDSVVGDLVSLFGEDDVDRFNPDEHSQLLDQMTIALPELPELLRPMTDLGERLDTIAPDAVGHQLAKTLLALLRSQADRRPPWQVLQQIERLFEADVAAARLDQAVDIARELQELAILAPNAALQDAIHDSFERIGNAETIRLLIDRMHGAPPEQAAALEELLAILGTAATKGLLLMLAEENNRSRRRRLFDFVTSLGSVIVPEIRPFLSDGRWYVVRNMIALTRAVNDRTLLPEIRRCATHPDLRVRLEAIRTLMVLEPSPPKGLLEEAIRDPDPKVAEKAITLVGSYGIKEAVDPLLQVVAGNDVWRSRRNLRLRALRALGELAEPGALPRLQHFFSDSFLPWPSREERRAAYETLAAYPPNARAPLVEKGKRSRDPYVRQICEKLGRS